MKTKGILAVVSSFLVLLCLPDLTYALSGGTLGSADAQFLGETNGDRAGESIALVGDVNGDGYDDILIGAPFRDEGEVGAECGAAYLVLGGPGNWGLGTPLWSQSVVKYIGEAAGDHAGASVAGAGDVNGDGYDDVIIGAPYNDGYGSDRGALYLVLGSASPSGANLSSVLKYAGVANDDWVGESAAGAGDVNGDGFDDMLVGASGVDGGGTDVGRAYLILGRANPNPATDTVARYTGEMDEDHAGASVAGAGDVNGDGYDDLLIGAPLSDAGGENRGVTYLVLGSDSESIADMDLSGAIKYTGEDSFNEAGSSVAGAGDVNGDGYADLLIGAYRNSSNGNTCNGAAYLVLGTPIPVSSDLSSAIKYAGEAGSDYAGQSVAGAGDVNGDGYADLLIGAPYQGGADTGAAYLVLGSAAPASANLSAVIRYAGEAAGDEAGSQVAGAGDVDGDGYADLLVRARGNDNGFSDAGAVYVLFSDFVAQNHAPFGQRHRLWLNSGNALPAAFDQAGVRVDLTAGAVANGEIAVERHGFHPCNTSKRLDMPLWTVRSNKIDPSSGSSLTIRFEYTDGQVSGMNESNLGVWKRPEDDFCGAWTQINSGITRNTATNQIVLTLSSTTELGQYTLADSAPSPTAVSMMPMSVRLAQEPVWLVLLLALLVITAGGTYTYLRRQGMPVTNCSPVEGETDVVGLIAAELARRLRCETFEGKNEE